ncbi:MAG: protein-L-isoaspartate(D-aspartate) O-methyltransferase [Bacteroidetes bacterium]|nr:MAG: protein-L-isoaspartate(D-aspartate) O-methyltransferase [Bacteroidota bacterium]REK00971.1 MAG: protein-L-isoaspartate(D-aspartate) O-methyltransferase [Bacteroidota bacterium]REK34574.1 MAG: protein-L-isoaspartate(D-aspartate) O-methyltransferase [Bacteroidota bacterium]REK51833.1 MAG: protein-L-isoaspartate(D-aspartate) O-methyltransferase [Bacteroidota bacterium]
MRFSIIQSIFLIITSFLISEHVHAQDKYSFERARMVQSQIADRGITDQVTLSALKSVPRHLFVPEDQKSNAYSDYPLPIGYGQTISQPYIVAFMTEAISPIKGMKVLEIGTGSGYQAAVLKESGCEVYSIEIIPELYKQAIENITRAGYKNIRIKNADGYYGWTEHAPFDAIVVTAATEFIPPPLIGQLKEGGKMIIPLGNPYLVQQLTLAEKIEGKTITKSLLPVRFVPFTRN